MLPVSLCLSTVASVQFTCRAAQPLDLPAVASFFVEARWGAQHAADVTRILGPGSRARVADTAQLPNPLRHGSVAGADSAVGGLTALQRELLERHASGEMQERFFSATARLPASLYLALDAGSGALVGCAGVEAAVVDRRRSLVLRRTCTPLRAECKPDGSLPDGMEVILRHAVCHQLCHYLAMI